MDISKEAKEILDKIWEETKPLSIFIYGSRAKGDFGKDSDYEIGVIYKDNNYTSRRELKKMYSLDNLNIFPFKYNELVSYQLDTPFPKAIFLRDVISGGRTYIGEKVVEKLKSPDIKLPDLLEEVAFQLAYALASTHSFKQGDLVTCSTHFTKSLFYGVRVLEIIQDRKFPLTFDSIAAESKTLSLGDEVDELIQHAVGVRNGAKPDIDKLYTNISFLNMVVLKRVKEELEKGDRIILH